MLSTGSQETMKASSHHHPQASPFEKVEITFDPHKIHSDPFTFSPEHVKVRRDEMCGVEFVLETVGHSRKKATFNTKHPIQWADKSLRVTICEASPTRLLVDTSEHHHLGHRRLAYHVQVKYDGEHFRSTGYPTYEEQDPVG